MVYIRGKKTFLWGRLCRIRAFRKKDPGKQILKGTAPRRTYRVVGEWKEEETW